MVGSELPSPQTRSDTVSEQTLLSVRGLTVAGEGARKVLEDISFDIHAGEIYGIAGVEGNGQSELVEALMGKWVDVAVLGPESYVIAHNKDATIEVFATYYKTKVGVQEAGPGYKSLLLTKKGSKFTPLDSLNGSVSLLLKPTSPRAPPLRGRRVKC